MVALESTEQLDRGDRAPPFELRGTDGRTYTRSDFADYDGLLFVFTCNHCPYAKAKFEELNRLAAEFDEVAVVGVNPNDPGAYPEDDFETMQERVADGTIAYDAYLHDEAQTVAAAYGATCTPDPFLFENTARTEPSLQTADDGFHLVYHGRLDDALSPGETPESREMASHIESMLAGELVPEAFRPSRGCSIKWRDGNEPDYLE